MGFWDSYFTLQDITEEPPSINARIAPNRKLLQVWDPLPDISLEPNTNCMYGLSDWSMAESAKYPSKEQLEAAKQKPSYSSLPSRLSGAPLDNRGCRRERSP